MRQCDFGQLFMENVLSGALCSQWQQSYTVHAFQKNVISYPDVFTEISEKKIDFSEFASGKTDFSVVSGAYGLFQNMHISSGSVEEQVNAAVALYEAQGMAAWAL